MTTDNAASAAAEIATLTPVAAGSTEKQDAVTRAAAIAVGILLPPAVADLRRAHGALRRAGTSDTFVSQITAEVFDVLGRLAAYSESQQDDPRNLAEQLIAARTALSPSDRAADPIDKLITALKAQA